MKSEDRYTLYLTNKNNLSAAVQKTLQLFAEQLRGVQVVALTRWAPPNKQTCSWIAFNLGDLQ
jgi:hypothetical protein